MNTICWGKETLLSPMVARLKYVALREGKIEEKFSIVKDSVVRLFTITGAKQDVFFAAPEDHFWEKVRQLCFYLEDQKWDKVKEFCTIYGPIKPWFVTQEGSVELIEPSTKKALWWFRSLTNLVNWVKNHKIAPIVEFLDSEGGLFAAYSSFALSSPVPLGMKKGHPDIEAGLGVAKILDFLPGMMWDVVLKAVTEPLASEREIALLVEQAQQKVKDEEVLAHVWNLISAAVAAKIQTIELVPISQPVSQGVPPTVWYFRAYCALDAAFLQWYFQEVAPLNLGKCKAPGCNAPVFSSKRQYCSRTCYERAKKRRYLERKRKARESQ